jgi:predicted amidohydrolase
MNYTISLAQLHIHTGQPDLNMKCAEEMIHQAAQRKSHLILFPELWSSGYDLEHGERYAAETPRILAELQRLSRQHHIYIGGSLLENTPQGIFNRFAWVSPSLPDPIFYRKIHLFRLMAEDQWLQPGDRLQTVQAPWGLTGLAICYDLRFPEIFRRYAVEGCHCLVISAEWPIRRIYHWQTLLRSRAIENQCFVFAANSAGVSQNEHFGGRSAVITPWGEPLVEGSQDDEELLTAQIDTAQIEQARSFLPVFQDRRPELYL